LIGGVLVIKNDPKSQTDSDVFKQRLKHFLDRKWGEVPNEKRFTSRAKDDASSKSDKFETRQNEESKKTTDLSDHKLTAFHILRLKKIVPSEKVLLLLIEQKENNNQKTIGTYEFIGLQCGIKREALRKIIERLVIKGLITKSVKNNRLELNLDKDSLLKLYTEQYQ